MVPCTVVIGAAHLLKALKERAGGGDDILTFSDSDPLGALEAITARRPQVIELERLFAATSRGAALINRIKADPALSASEIRIVSHDGKYSRVSPRRPEPAAAPAPAAAPPVALDYHGTRRAPRFRMADGTSAQINGAPAVVIDLSVIGAQIISKGALKPAQRIRFALVDDTATVRIAATVAWASFEIPKATPRYRAGLEFRDADVKAVEAFCKRHKK